MPQTMTLRLIRLVAASSLAALLVLVLGIVIEQEAGAATAADCVAGQYFDSTAGECVLADVGFFVASAGALSQVAIPLGSGGTGGTDDGRGSTGTALCVAGTFRGDASTTRCTRAAVGFFVEATGAQSQVAIPLGRGGTGGDDDGRGSTGTAACEAGTFRGDANSTRCTRAAVGFFVADEGAQTQVAIPLGSRGTGGDAEGRGSKAVELCPAGTFRGDAATTSCSDAPAGRFVATTGAQEATVCPLGRFQDETGKTSCKEAPAGSHVPVTGATAAALCAPGTFSAAAGASQCTPAAVGYYVPRPGATQQLRCVTATEPGLSRCPTPTAVPTPAPPTVDAPATGDEPLSPQGDECPPGSWSTTGTSRAGSSCTPASPGTFVAESGATAQTPCPAGTYSDTFGATECTPAPVGTFVAQVGAMDPMPCPGATEPGMTECPEVIAMPVIEAVVEPTPSTPVWWWIVGLTLAVAVGGAGFVLVQRRTGALDAAVSFEGAGAATLTDLPGIDATWTDMQAVASTEPAAPHAPAAPAAAPDALEWDEALDGRLDDQEPPPAPRA
jgi:hypothetical protein